MHAVAWLVVVVMTAIRLGEVPPQLWAALPLGVGAIMAAFRADDAVHNRATPRREDSGR